MVLSDSTWADVYVQLRDVAWYGVRCCVMLRGDAWCCVALRGAACPYVVLRGLT